jgi:uncharacterized membrane protein
VLEIPAGYIAAPVMIWAGLLLLRSREAMPVSKRVVLFLLGTALAVTLFVELFSLEGDRMNTVFKFYIQVWVLLSVAGGAALAWLLAAAAKWRPSWRTLWTTALSILVAAAALYTVTATAAKIKDRFPGYVGNIEGCEGLPGMALPYAQGLPPDQQPHSLDGMQFMTWSAYCDHDAFLPLAYDYEGIRWIQDNIKGSPVIAEAQSFDLYKMSSRYTWFTGLPDVVGWDYHTRQHNAAIPTQFITERGNDIIVFYTEADIEGALAFIQKYDVRYIIVGPMERAYYEASGGLAKFDAMVSQGSLAIVHQNPGTLIYAVNPTLAGQ